MRTKTCYQSLCIASFGFCLLAVAVPSVAQAPSTSFPDVQKVAKIGERLVITHTSGTKVKGTLEMLSDSRIILNTNKGRREFAPHEVREIRRQPDPVWNGTLWGTMVGFGVGIGIGLTLDAMRGEGTWLAPRITAAGAGGGALAGWLGDTARRHDDVLFRQPQSRPSVLLQPTLSPGRLELRLMVRF